MVKTNETHFPAGMTCRLLLVSRSGHYAWKHRPPPVGEQPNRLLKIEVKRVIEDTRAQVKKDGLVHPGLPVDCRTKASQRGPPPYGQDHGGQWLAGEGWLCLAAVPEPYSGRVIGRATPGRMTATPVCDALTLALYPQGTSGTGGCQGA